jgi:hypothetical protein
MKAVFVELPPFERNRRGYLDDDEFRNLQILLIENPKAGDVIKGTGGLRKVRYSDARRGKGKRSGLRVIYYWWLKGRQFWLFTLYDKDEVDDLTAQQCSQLKRLLEKEVSERSAL